MSKSRPLIYSPWLEDSDLQLLLALQRQPERYVGCGWQVQNNRSVLDLGEVFFPSFDLNLFTERCWKILGRPLQWQGQLLYYPVGGSEQLSWRPEPTGYKRMQLYVVVYKGGGQLSVDQQPLSIDQGDLLVFEASGHQMSLETVKMGQWLLWGMSGLVAEQQPLNQR